MRGGGRAHLALDGDCELREVSVLRLVRLGQEEGTLRRALADVLSGEIAGAGFRPRAASAGSGSVARF